MHVRLVLAALVSLVLLSGCTTPKVGDLAEQDSVLAVLESWNEGWRTRDAALAVADYADDADWTNAYGDRFEGREDLRAGLEFIFGLDFVMAGDSADAAYEDVTFLADDVAIIRSQLTRTGQMTAAGDIMNDRVINHLRVVQRRGERWLIVSHLISQAREKGSR